LTPAAIVTGASRGLGRQIAIELARRDWALIGVGCSAGGAAAREAAAAVQAAGAQSVLLPGDLSDATSAATIVADFLESSRGRLDLLVNNAGTFRAGTVARMSEAEWDRQVEVNLSAAFRLMRAAGAALTASEGAVVNVSSICGFRGAAGAGPYSAAKAGLEALTRAAAVEWGNSGVRVNAVIPGFLYETDMGRMSTDEYVDEVLAQSPLGRPAEVAAAARTVAELVEMKSVTGQVLSLESRVGRADTQGFSAG
jgi:3-oxoacyl-[acyl-carrier protein] reductase